jgi:hypothetical protein
VCRFTGRNIGHLNNTFAANHSHHPCRWSSFFAVHATGVGQRTRKFNINQFPRQFTPQKNESTFQQAAGFKSPRKITCTLLSRDAPLHLIRIMKPVTTPPLIEEMP